MKPAPLLALVLLAACEGNIVEHLPGVPPSPVPDPIKTAAPLVSTCTARGQGPAAKMRLIWQEAYLTELSTHLGSGAAAVAHAEGLSPATTKGFGYQSAGALLTDSALSTLADSADAVAQWALDNAPRVFGCEATELTVDKAEPCFRQFLSTTGARLLRRPLSDEELRDALKFFRAQAAAGTTPDAREGFRQGLASLLVHPDFLYLHDVPDPSGTALEPFSLASRLSFALTGHGPDDALFAAAQDGSLAAPDVLRAQVKRLLQTDDARAQMVRFYRQWLGYDRGAYAYSPAFLDGLDTAGLKDAATAELDAFVGALTFEQQGTAADLLTSRLSPALSAPLAQVYGTAQNAGTLGEDRAGLLTRVGLLASGSDDWHVVARGLPLLTSMLCRTIAPPTVNTAAALAQAASLQVSNYERMETVTAPSGCRTCHAKINPLGGARGDFDAIGRHVTSEKHYAGGVLQYEVPVDAQMDLSAVFNQPGLTTDGSVGLSQALAASDEFKACFAVQFVRHVLGRADDGDGCLAEDGAQQAAAGATLQQTVEAIMGSPELTLWRD
jgi:hypothetical protein